MLVQNSALKQHIFNHIRLTFQDTYFDAFQSCVVIIPMVDMELLKVWSDNVSYEAMVIVDELMCAGEPKLA